jgi:hypothetical protein
VLDPVQAAFNIGHARSSSKGLDPWWPFDQALVSHVRDAPTAP